ncbi:MAG: hypothetical protein SPI94_04135 [Candidatus Onthovivens sp.]|nr:hypothetical protein [Candidatus Onthovivens sp.]
MAKCHPDDWDYMSEYTGCEIAERRCKIKILQHIKNNQIIPQIQAYEHLISTMLNSKQLNPQSYEFKRIKAEYDNLLNQYTAIKNKIKYSQSKLREYIFNKESVNKFLRLRKATEKEKLFQDLGVTLTNPDGTFRSTKEVLEDLSKSWDKIDGPK